MQVIDYSLSNLFIFAMSCYVLICKSLLPKVARGEQWFQLLHCTTYEDTRVLFYCQHTVVGAVRTLYLLKAALGLQRRCQLLVLLHPHPDDVLQDFLSGLFSFHASVQQLPQGVNLGTDVPRQPGGSIWLLDDVLRSRRWSHGDCWHWTWTRKSFHCIKKVAERVFFFSYCIVSKDDTFLFDILYFQKLYIKK